ncbi:ribonuclease z/bn [Trichococcus palustris]|jgi:ribonuclease Z|uniref:Ribonuclease Z n=1 Tax=Trichococcus palustris TaxID=140314 RepID=A0A143YBW7_9LACT|nr:ribonuclease Z [Trichococcus palustris]CZQ86943.1 ribonuclease z/bn [Trichococcus palustris]SFK80244.1 ribonuclease Z [Trichococcus palustris]
MKIQFLGTGAGVPSTSRNLSSIALKLLDERNAIWLFDCGEGTQQRVLKTAIRPRKIEKIFITHLHGDHIFGLPGLLSSRAFQGGNTPLNIYGPKGVKEFVLTSLRISQSHLRYPIFFHEIEEEGVIFEDEQFRVSCMKLNHGIVSYGYRVEEADYPGELQAERLKEQNVPAGPLYGKLKNGETVTLPDGRIINGQDFIGRPTKGRIVTILGDTRRTKNTVVLAKDANVLIHESTFGKEDQAIAADYFHSTCIDAANVAKEAGVKQLYLTHISARYLSGNATQLQKDARRIFENSKLVNDYDEFDVPLEKL